MEGAEDKEEDFRGRREPEMRRGRSKNVAKIMFLFMSRRLEIAVILNAILLDD